MNSDSTSCIEHARHVASSSLIELRNAQRRCDRAVDARASVMAGTSRARVTTLNARWARAAEYRDLCLRNARWKITIALGGDVLMRALRDARAEIVAAGGDGFACDVALKVIDSWIGGDR